MPHRGGRAFNFATGRGVAEVGVGGVPRPPPRRAEEDAHLLILKAGCEPTSRALSVGRARPFVDVAAEQAT